MIDFRSDNTGRAAPEILEALVRANRGTALGYGGDDWTATLQQRFSELFETSVRVFPVATGTAANALALASLGPSWGIVYCSEVAHINTADDRLGKEMLDFMAEIGGRNEASTRGHAAKDDAAATASPEGR